jgi:hypothetical protein
MEIGPAVPSTLPLQLQPQFASQAIKISPFVNGRTFMRATPGQSLYKDEQPMLPKATPSAGTLLQVACIVFPELVPVSNSNKAETLFPTL